MRSAVDDRRDHRGGPGRPVEGPGQPEAHRPRHRQPGREPSGRAPPARRRGVAHGQRVDRAQPSRPPGGVELTAYRVVQEALTNALKHAAGSRADVRVDYGEDELRLEITDSGGTPGPAAATGNGRGLIGLRERLAVHGGTLDNGPRPLGGYRVRALIPLERT